jgi:hypothetical protein
MAGDHCKRAGLVDPHLSQISSPPEGAEVVDANSPPDVRGGAGLGLFWTIVIAVVVGNLATAVIMKIISSL